MTLIALFIGLLVAGLALRRRILALQVVVALLPSYLIRFAVVGIPMTLLEVIILGVTLVALRDVACDPNARARLREIVIRHRAFFFFVALFALAGTIGVATGPDLRSALGVWKTYFMEPLLVLGACLLWIQTREQFFRVVDALIGSASMVALYGLVQLATPTLIPPPWNEPALLRVTSLYPYPNALGLYLAPVLAMTCVMLWKKRNVSMRSYLALASANIVMAAAILASRSDGAVVGAAAALWFLGVTTRARRYWVGGGIVLLLTFLITPTLRDVILPIITLSDVSGDVRKVLWLGTYHLLLDHPLFGAGLSGFPQLYDLYREARHVELLQYPHNILLNFWVETGVLGVISVVGMLALSARRAWTAWADPLIGYGFAMLLVIVIHGAVDVPFFKNDLAVLWWMAFLPFLLSGAWAKKSRA